MAGHGPDVGIAQGLRPPLNLRRPLFPEEAKRLKLGRPRIRRTDRMVTEACPSDVTFN